MADDERSLLASFLRTANTYVEFGCGGSTVLAASLVGSSVVALDSSQSWLEQVANHCQQAAGAVIPKLVLADIGPTGEWGRPVDESCREQWPIYSQRIWEEPGTEEADLYLVDGRFRVACFLETLSRCKAEAVVLIHDFAPRPDYHCVSEFAHAIALCGTLSAFVKRSAVNWERLRAVLERARFEPG